MLTCGQALYHPGICINKEDVMNRLVAVSVGLMVSLGFPGALQAQDVLKAGPDVYKVLFENERIRVIEGTFKPGGKVGMHSHPDHAVYVAEAGSLRITKPDGTSSVIEPKKGEVLWLNAESHSGENVGKTTMKLIVTELKGPMAAGK
jgi:quercetin dioxygenase-like cupin family protein